MSHTVATTEAAATAQPRKRRRVFMWIFLAIQAAFIAWVISAAASGGGIHADVAAQCLKQAQGMGMTQAQCISWLGGASKAGVAVGVALQIVLWTITDIILGISYGVYRLATRGSRQAVSS
jgi:hypothetical protein